MFKGIPASKGIGIGKAIVLKSATYEKQFENKKIKAEETEAEMTRLKAALEATAQSLEQTKEKAAGVLSEAEVQVFEAYKMVLGDPIFNDMVGEAIKKELSCAEGAVSLAVQKIKAMFLAIDNDYMRQRAEDIENVGKSVIGHLQGKEAIDLSSLKEDVIIVASDLTPADTVSLDRKHVKGFAIEKGGETSHTAIIARTLEIPALVGCGAGILQLKDGDTLIIDGEEGVLLQNPGAEEIESYKDKQKKYIEKLEQIKKLKDAPSVTKDGVNVELLGNIAKPDEAAEVLASGGEGIGLFRTEFLYMDSKELPSEDEQFASYKKVAEITGDRECIIRTMDIGGDKKLACLNLPQEENPFLGYRAIRICLDETEMFKTQLKAILRASVYGNLKIMFPMISGLAELKAAKKVLQEAKAELTESGIKFNEDIKVGVMIEVPSAAIAADILAKEADFFSIGTNDLCQYTLAVDRMNEKISYLYDPLNIGVLRLIKMVIDAAHKRGIKVGMCGEMASNAETAVLLLGMGLDEFSMVPSAIPHVKNAIRNMSFEKAGEIANKVLEMEDSKEIVKYIKEELYVD